MGVIAKYKFDQTIYENFIPVFNSGFTNYTITDEIDTDGFTIRTIVSDDLPTVMKFGQTWVSGETGATDKSRSLLEIYECNANNITNMNDMFRYCTNLILLDTSNFNTDKVGSMSSMFQYCSSLTSLDVSNFNTSQSFNMNGMFRGCSSLTSLDVSNFNTEKATNIGFMFHDCNKLTSLDLSNFNTEKVTNMDYMFQNCSSLTSLDLSNFNTQSVTTMTQMFHGCSSLTSLDISNFNTEKVASMSSMFNGCSKLTSLDLSNFNTEKVTNMQDMFNGCSKLTSLDLSNFNTEKVTTMINMFANCSSLTSLDLSNFNTSNVGSMYYIFNNTKNLVDIGMTYCNSDTVNKISDLITTNKTIWYQDANISDLTVKDNITYKKYQTTTLSLNEPIQLRSIGDVHDEIDYETGEYIQRIGEVVLDGSEEWVKHGAYSTDNMEVYWTYNNFIPTKARATEIVCDKLITANPTTINSIRTNGEGGLFIGIPCGVNIINYIQTNPLTVQFVLTKPIITKIDTTILDQNNSYKSSQQTYDEQTYISVQSDTVVTPSSNIDYEIYSSTGTITGTSATIDNAEAGTPVSGVVYGESLLNVIQEPSDIEYVVLGEHSGSNITIENSVAGNIKNAVIKGDTLVNLCPPSIYTASAWVGSSYKIFNDFSMLEKGKRYTFYSPIINKTGNASDATVSLIVTTDGIAETLCSTWGNSHGTIYENFTMGDELYFNNFNVNGSLFKINYPNTIILEGDYTQEEIASIPYFEGMKSVTNPSVTVCGKNLAINKPNTTQEYGGVVFTTDGNKFTMTGKNTGYFGYDFASQEVSPQLQAYGILQSTIDFYNGKILVDEPGTYTISSLFKTTNTSELSGSGLHISLKVHYDDNKSVDIAPSSANSTNYENGQRWLSRKFTVEKHINGIWLGLWYTGIDFSKYSVENIQLEKGSTATTYEPYVENTIVCSESTSLYKIRDIQDELDLSTGVLTRNMDKITDLGNYNMPNYQVHNVSNEASIPVLKVSFDLPYVATDCPLSATSNLPIICDRYNVRGDTNEYDISRGSYVSTRNGQLFLHLIKEEVGLPTDATISKQTLQDFFKEKPIEVVYKIQTPNTQKLDLITLDQDNNPTTFHTYDTITCIKASSDYLKPILEITNPTYDVILKANTEYTIKTNRTNRATLTSDVALDVNLGGSTISMDSVTNHVKVKTPSTLENNTLTLSGFGNKVKEVMVIEGDYVDRDLDFFEGFISVENPIMNIYHDIDNINFYNIVKWKTGSDTSELCRLPIKGQTIWYKVNGFMWNYVGYYDKDKNFLGQETNQGMGGNYQLNNSLLKPELKSKAVYFTINKRGNPTNGGYPQLRTKNNKPDIPPTPLNEICRLMTYPQVTLRSIGDIKDEWDVVGETVTRRIGEVVLDGSEDWKFVNGGASHGFYWYQNADILNIGSTVTALKNIKIYCNHLQFKGYGSALTMSLGQIQTTSNRGIVVSVPYDNAVLKEKLRQNPIVIYIEADAPITESVRITPPNPQTSSASITIPTQLNHVEDTSDFLVWNPYKEHYVRYNYVEDGVVLDNYTWENLTDLNERQFVQFYNRRTYIDQPYHNYVASHDSKGTSKYVLIEPNQDYTVNVRFSELPTCETVKVNLGGTEVEMNVNDPHVHVTTPNTLLNNLCSISGDGLDGKVTDILVIHCLEHEGFADIDYFEGIDGIGEIVEVDGVGKASIVMEQTNGNLLDFEPVVFNNGNYISMGWDDTNKAIPIHQNKEYVFKFPKRFDNEWGDYGLRLYDSNFNQTRTISNSSINNWRRFIFTPTVDEKYIRMFAQFSSYGETHCHVPVELCYADMEKDYIRPRYYDKEEILLPMQLHRINTVYDNFYYDEMKGFYRIQQSIGHKYFVGADSENWTLIERGQRVLRFRYNNADIQIKSLGEFTTNILPNGTATSPYECCAFSGSTFIVSIDKERLTSESLIAFKEWLANNNLHLYYQLASPLMIDLPQYPNRIEFNTYKDEIYTFFKNCKPTVFTLSVPLDQTYRFYELEQGEGYANRVELTDERMTEEDTLYIDTIYGSGISNLIEEPNNVDTMLKPNYEGKATSHSLTNGKVSTIAVHGFEPNNVTISNYNTVTKQYELTVQAQQGTNTNTKVLPIPYKFEVYEDGTKDKVYYNSQYKQWMFEGGQALTVPYNESTGAFTSAIEVFRGLQPRSGLIGEFKVRFASGTTSARLYYSINGTTYGYTTLRGMTDEVDYYIGFFNTGGSKIDMGTKIDANAEYTTLVPINATVPECLMINQIQSITECTYYQDKTYYYSDVVSPLLLDVYNGTTTITELNGAVIDIQNNAHNKQALIYGDTTYTVYWIYVGGEGNIKVTLGGVTQEVVATQGYVTITTSNIDLERGLLIGGFDVTIKDLMLIKGERITDLKYFEGSRAVGTAFTDEDGNTMYKITFVTGSELINDKFEGMITFEDNKKHNVVVTKLLGAKPNKN